ncbi:MAG TPA: ATPase, partial [Devosiaceae bacterium]|nr:ATPase [Devosiaceae bacterium]
NRDALIRRFKSNPKPMYYRPDLLDAKWDEYKKLNGIVRDDDVDPGDFGAWGFEAILEDRLPRYQALARRHGYSVSASDAASVRDGADFDALMAKAISRRKAA